MDSHTFSNKPSELLRGPGSQSVPAVRGTFGPETAPWDFDDLLMKTVRLFRDHSDVLKRYQRRYIHILVDEFQDTNVAQYGLAKLLAEGYRNICVVGGRRPVHLRLAPRRHTQTSSASRRDYPEARTVALEENYRSTGAILDAAKHLISANRMRIPKDLHTQKEGGHPVVVHEVYNEEEEAQFVIREIGRLSREEKFKEGDCAVMYRVNAQSRALEEACLRYGDQVQAGGRCALLSAP